MQKRRWFQIHLATAIVSILTAGFLVAVNLIEDIMPVFQYYVKTTGWPLVHKYDDGSVIEFRLLQSLINVAVCAAVTALTGFVCELLVRRRLCRIQLSTGIIMMIVAGLLIWANTVRSIVYFGDIPSSFQYGWPRTMCTQWINYPDSVGWWAKDILLNLAACLLLLLITAATSESLIRRREARKP